MGKRIKFKCIYVLLGPNKTAYVGQTTDPVNRKSRYKTITCKNQTNVYKSLIEHGYDAHEFKILLRLPDDATREQMDHYEGVYFETYRSAGYELMNLKSAGWNGKPCAESIEKARLSMIGKKPWNTVTKGVCKAWNKGLHITRKTYKLINDGQEIVITDLKKFCSENSLNYTTMVHFLSGKGQYSNQNKFRNYERV